MNSEETPTILIAYPKEFSCFDKFERKVSSILSGLSNFKITYMDDYNNYISTHLSSDQRVYDSLSSPVDEEHLSRITHAIIFNDGETFNQLIENTTKEGIKSRVINTDITKVVNIDKSEKYDVYIGRGTPWGNPHAVGFGASIGEEQNDRNEAIRKFQYDFDRGFLKNKKEDFLSLKGKVLGCHCKPQACHGDVIVNYLNSLDDGR